MVSVCFSMKLTSVVLTARAAVDLLVLRLVFREKGRDDVHPCIAGGNLVSKLLCRHAKITKAHPIFPLSFRTQILNAHCRLRNSEDTAESAASRF